MVVVHTVRMEAKDMELAIIRSLPKKTGKTLEQWIAVLERSGPQGRSERIEWLISTHGIGHFQARTIAYQAEKRSSESDERKAEALFSRASPDALAVYGVILMFLRTLGNDIRATSTGEHMIFSCTRTFLAITPVKNGLSMGLSLSGESDNARFAPPTDFSQLPEITHQILLSSPQDVDNVVKTHIASAYLAQ